MPRIDVYLENLPRHHAHSMVLVADQPILLQQKNDTQRLRKSCTGDEILTLVHEILDSAQRKQLVVDGELRFAYRSDSAGPVQVKVVRQASGVRCELRRARGRREPVEG